MRAKVLKGIYVFKKLMSQNVSKTLLNGALRAHWMNQTSVLNSRNNKHSTAFYEVFDNGNKEALTYLVGLFLYRNLAVRHPAGLFLHFHYNADHTEK